MGGLAGGTPPAQHGEELRTLEPRFEIRPSGERWFDVEMSLASADGEKFSAADIQRLILSGNGTTRLEEWPHRAD
jgi:hypothetical protein